MACPRPILTGFPILPGRRDGFSKGDEDEIADAEQQEWLKAQIGMLDPQIVRMIELRYEQNWTLARISKLLGLSIGTIDWRLRKALGKIREKAVEAFEMDP